MITLTFRLDDYSSSSSTTFEEQLIGIFDRYDWTCTFGVIPLVASGEWFDFSSEQETIPLTAEKSELIRSAVEQGAVEVALHGLTHQSAGQYNGVHHGEFAGVASALQREKLEIGREELATRLGIVPDLFLPPWNSYDEATLRALTDTGFTGLSSGGRFGGVLSNGRLEYLPATCTAIHLKEVVEAARNTSDPAPIIVVVLHEYEFTEVDPERGVLSFDDFERLLRWVTDQPDLTVQPMSELMTSGQVDTSARRFRLNHQIRGPRRLIPPAFRGLLPRAFHQSYPSDVYWSATAARRERNKVYLLTGLLYAAVVVAAALGAYGMMHAVQGSGGDVAAWRPWLLGGSASVLLAAGGFLTAKKTLYYRGALLLAALAGATLGLWITLL
jgi:peptidoglycan/xylan/chitin deacetylase (PgdA/CDA1 family)